MRNPSVDNNNQGSNLEKALVYNMEPYCACLSYYDLIINKRGTGQPVITIGISLSATAVVS
jgi:hypothetical protein